MLLVCAGAASKGASTQKSMDAYLKYTGANEGIDKILKDIQKPVPDTVKYYIGSGVYIGQTLIDRKIVITFHFP